MLLGLLLLRFRPGLQFAFLGFCSLEVACRQHPQFLGNILVADILSETHGLCRFLAPEALAHQREAAAGGRVCLVTPAR